MNYKLYANPENVSLSSFCFINPEDERMIAFGSENESITRGKRDTNAKLGYSMSEKYGNYLNENKFISTFPSQENNLFIVLGTGHVNVKYSDGEEQIFTNIYSVDTWLDYQDVWNYSKTCHVELHGNVSLLRIMLEGDRSLWRTKVCILNSDDESLKISNISPSNEKNNTIIHSPEFEFNAVSYSIFDKPIGLVKTFKNNKNITVKTRKYTTIVYSEYM